LYLYIACILEMDWVENYLSTKSSTEREEFERKSKEIHDDIEKNRNNVDYWFPIVRWRTNYEDELQDTIQHVEQRLKDENQKNLPYRNRADEYFYVKCPYCVRYFRAWGGGKKRDNDSYQGDNCSASINYHIKAKRYFIRCNFGSYLDGDILGFVDRKDEPKKLPRHEVNNMCDYCIVQKLKQRQLKIVHVGMCGDVTNDMGTLNPSEAEIAEIMSMNSSEKLFNVSRIS